MTAFETAWELIKNVPRFAYHGGHVPIGEPIDPSMGGNNNHAAISTLPHNEILNRPHGVFSIPIGAESNRKLSVSRLLNQFRNQVQGGKEHYIIDTQPYRDETIAGNMLAGDAMGNFYQALEEANVDFHTPYDQQFMDELKENIQTKYEAFNMPLSQWGRGVIGEREFIPSRDPYTQMFAIDAPDMTEIPFEIPADVPEMMHELITPRAIDPEDVLPMYGNSQRKIKEWMAERVRDDL